MEKMKEKHTIAGWEQGLRQRDGESTEEYTARLTDALGVLDEFCNSMEMKNRRFMVKKYQKAIFDVVTDNILRTVGENISRKVSKGKKIGVAIGAGGFNHWSSFESHFVRKVESLGYHVFLIDERYTSQKCPQCFRQ